MACVLPLWVWLSLNALSSITVCFFHNHVKHFIGNKELKKSLAVPSLATPLTAPALVVKGVLFMGAWSQLHPILPSSSSSSEKSKSERSSVLTLETEMSLSSLSAISLPNHFHLKTETPPLRTTRENFHIKFACIFCMEQLSFDKRKQCSNSFSDWLRGSSNKRTTITIFFRLVRTWQLQLCRMALFGFRCSNRRYMAHLGGKGLIEFLWDELTMFTYTLSEYCSLDTFYNSYHNLTLTYEDKDLMMTIPQQHWNRNCLKTRQNNVKAVLQEIS